MDLPPGIIYLLQRLPYLLSPPILTYCIIHGLEALFGVYLSAWTTIFSYLASLPLALTFIVVYYDIKYQLQAYSHGATLAPLLADWSPGGIKTLMSMLRTDKQGYMGDEMVSSAKKVGSYTFRRRILFQDRIITSEPDYIKQLKDCTLGPETRFVLCSLLGTGVFAADGTLQFHRSMTRPFFSRDRISHFDIFDKHAEDAIHQLKKRLAEGCPVDFQDLAARFTLDSATEFLFGNDVHSLSAGLPYPFYSSLRQAEVRKAFSEAQSVVSARLRLGVHWPLYEFWNDRIKGSMKIIHGFIDSIVAEAIFKKREDKERGADDQTLLENLVNTTEDPVILRDEIMSLLTASALSFVVYMLAEYPDVLRRLREEVMQRVGPNRRPTSEDFREMKYLRAVINETLRLYPVVASTQGCILPSKDPKKKPIYIPPHTRTPYSVFTMHRRTDLWGPDALEFDPDRFLDERLQKYLIPNPFIFLPFNAGPRICLGQQFAYNEASYFLVKLLQNFSAVSLATEAQPVDSRPPASWSCSPGRRGKEKIYPGRHLTMYIKGGLWVRMEEAKV
ncbi:cytochrome P450 [Cyathus striatus]|nr:cytochrome P450 [Cyathus striatus]